LLGISEIDNSPTFSLFELKKLLQYEELAKNNQEKIDIEDKVQSIIFFST
jgi:hypothetical protein